MAETETTNEAVGERRHRTRNRWLIAIGAVLGVGLVALGITAEYVARNAGPLLRSSVVETLSSRFHSPVELDSLDISVAKGLQVHGRGLRILYLAGPTLPGAAERQGRAAPPMLSVNDFTFRTTLSDLLHLRANIARVDVDGMELRIPPHDEKHVPRTQAAARIKLAVAKIYCRNVKLVIETSVVGKEPLRFNIRNLELTEQGPDQPLLYVADVVNPKPVGDVHATGHFGPWQGDDPRATALEGRYTYEHVDLNSIKGLGGTLSSAGEFEGRLGHLTVDGTTSTLDFSLDVSDHPMPLETKFEAFVDGTTGDTTLNAVEAQLGQSKFHCAGTIERIAGKGHDIALTVGMPQGRIEDILRLVMKTSPAVMRGGVALQAKLHIPPGETRVPEKMELAGTMRMQRVEFTSSKLQGQVNSLSKRAQGKPGEAKAAAAGEAGVASEMAATFTMAHAMLMVQALEYKIPGATVNLVGVYPLDGYAFDFRGHVATEATASQMLTGWKALLMKPFNGVLQKGGKGADIPIEISGSHGNFDVGFAMHGKDETPEQMLADMKAQSLLRRQNQNQ